MYVIYIQMDQLTLVFVSDTKYIQYLRTLITSVQRNCLPGYLNFHIHLINIDETSHIVSELKSLTTYPMEFSFSYPKAKLVDDFKSFCANIRIKVLYDLLLKGYKYLFYLDADSIVRKDLTPLFDFIKTTEITFVETTAKKISKKYKSGALGITLSPGSLLFYKKFNDLLEKVNYLGWFEDQRNLCKMHQQFILVPNPICIFKNLDLTFLDWEFMPNSVIWTGKGPRKTDNQTYIAEVSKYASPK